MLQPEIFGIWMHELALLAASFFLCLFIMYLHSRVSWLQVRGGDLSAVQVAHVRQTSRLGGLAVFVAIVLSLSFAPVSISEPYAQFLLATSLLFFVGLAEDLGFHVQPRLRLLAAIVASLLVIAFLGVWLPRTGIPGLEDAVDHWAIGIPLTLFVTAALANGFNFIDGVNGLASLTAIVAALAMSQIAGATGYEAMVVLATMLAAALLGFFLLNYPWGRIFLGDAGAYTVGFVLAWFGISIMLNAPEVSPWAILLTVYWPFADTSLAILRRVRRKTTVSSADRLHVHQMVMRALEICWVGRKRRNISNPLTTLVLAPFICAPPIAGVLLWDQNRNAFLALAGFCLVFFASYAAVPRVIRQLRR